MPKVFQDGDVLSAQDLNGIVQNVKAGSATVAGNGTTISEVAVTFDQSFASPPIVVAGSGRATSTISIIGEAVSVTTTGFILRVTSTNGNFSSSYVMKWIAVGVD